MADLAARHFAQSYSEARQKFIMAVERQDLALERHVHPEARGIEGEDLSMDCALAGPVSSDRLLILSSGTHGVEGFCGSGAQVALLHDAEFLAEARAGRAAILFIHAVNPFGFSHWGRTNEENVDLNRNFIDHGLVHPANSGYAEIHPLLVSDTWPPSPEHEAAIGRFISQRGLPAFQQAVSGGQYDYPDGLFFGGLAPTWSNRTIRKILKPFRSSVRRVFWIDFHSGLGQYGHGEIIHSGRDDDAELARATAVWGPQVKSMYKGTSVSAQVDGILTLVVYAELPQADFTGCAIEFGTVPVMQVLQALRAENCLRRNASLPQPQRSVLRRLTRDAFYCDAEDWKAMVVERGREVVLQALAYMSAR